MSLNLFFPLGAPKVLEKVESSLSKLKMTVHAHRSPVVLDKVFLGEYSLGLCPGDFNSSDQLQAELLFWEPMVLMRADCDPKALKKKKSIKVMTIEEHSETWKFIGPQLKHLNQKVIVERRLESFFSVASMAPG